MSVVTLTTDWGLRDHHVAAFKGRLASLLPGVEVIDITHMIHAHDTLEASYILKNAWTCFPQGSVHYSGMMGLPPNILPELVIVQAQGHYFVGMDNGLFSLVLGDTPRQIYGLALDSPPVWADAAVGCIASLVRDHAIPEGAVERKEIINTFSPQPMADPDGIRATVVYVDEFENLVLNVSRELFENLRNDRKFSIELKRVNQPIRRISNWYHEVEEGELLALFNADGFLEIALNRANAGGLLGIHLYDTVRISFS